MHNNELMTFIQDVRALRDKYESVAGIRPPCPKSRNAYDILAATLKHYELGTFPISESVKEQILWDEFARLRGINDIIIPKNRLSIRKLKC